MSNTPAAPVPFPVGSVQGVASRAWDLCLRRDPIGLLVIPFIIFFPVYVFLTLLAEVVRDIERISQEGMLLGAVVGVLPLVIFARVFGEAWILVRADAIAHGRPLSYGATFSHALARSWFLVVVMLVVYALVQVGIFFFVIPGIIVWVLCSFANQAAVLGPGRLFASLRQSRDLVEHQAGAWLGMVIYWVIVFVGLGILSGIVRQTIEGRWLGPDGAFLADLVLGLPLQLCLLVFTTSWTLFYREIEARRARQIESHVAQAAHAAHAAAAAAAHAAGAAPEAAGETASNAP